MRPVIAIDICENLGGKLDDVINFAVAIELIHNSSLIIDDLPCMDDDNFRRNKLSFHKKYNQYQAQIISNLMINIALKLINLNFKNLNQNIFNILVDNIVKNLGIMGATGGQLLDLTPININNKSDLLDSLNNEEVIKDLFKKKTASFFEIAFVGGYLSGKGNLEYLSKIEVASYNFGILFQIYDDIDDIKQDKKRIDKNLFDPNFVNNFGLEIAKKEFNKSRQNFIEIMTKQCLYSNIMIELIKILSKRIR